jgi:hypothetical protein
MRFLRYYALFLMAPLVLVLPGCNGSTLAPAPVSLLPEQSPADTVKARPADFIDWVPHSLKLGPGIRRFATLLYPQRDGWEPGISNCDGKKAVTVTLVKKSVLNGIEYDKWSFQAAAAGPFKCQVTVLLQSDPHAYATIKIKVEG